MNKTLTKLANDIEKEHAELSYKRKTYCSENEDKALKKLKLKYSYLNYSCRIIYKLEFNNHTYVIKFANGSHHQNRNEVQVFEKSKYLRPYLYQIYGCSDNHAIIIGEYLPLSCNSTIYGKNGFHDRISNIAKLDEIKVGDIGHSNIMRRNDGEFVMCDYGYFSID